MSIKKRIKKSLLIKNAKLVHTIINQKKIIAVLEDKIEDLEFIKKELKDVNFEISSNNDYLIEQRKKTNKKIKKILKELEELKQERENKNERKN